MTQAWTSPYPSGDRASRLLLLLGLAFLPSLAAAKTRTLTIDEMVGLKRVSQPAISPDGSRVAYAVRQANWDDNAFENRIWIADVATGRSLPFTGGAKSSEAPSFSPDGSALAFLSDRDGKRQLYVMSLSGGEARRISTGSTRTCSGLRLPARSGRPASAPALRACLVF